MPVHFAGKSCKMREIQIIARKEWLPEDFGRFSRNHAVAKYKAIVEVLEEIENGILLTHGIEMESREIEILDEEFRQYRIALREEGLFDNKMLTVMRKLRCRKNPDNTECTAFDKE